MVITVYIAPDYDADQGYVTGVLRRELRGNLLADAEVVLKRDLRLAGRRPLIVLPGALESAAEGV
jgi:hypothetical protein